MIKLLAIGLMSSSLGLGTIKDEFYFIGGDAQNREYDCTLDTQHTADFNYLVSPQAPNHVGPAICAFLEDSYSWSKANQFKRFANNFGDLQSISSMIMQTNTNIEKGGFNLNSFKALLKKSANDGHGIELIFRVNYHFLGHNLYSGCFQEMTG